MQRREWLHNMDIVRPDENHQRPVQQWNKDCVGCHVSEQDNNYRPATGEFATTWRDFGTSCERCHGPGSAHVDAYRRANRSQPTRGNHRPPDTTRSETSSMICAQCHSLRNAIDPDYQAGRNYYDYFMPRLEYEPRPGLDVAYWPDGRPRRFSNDAIGLWQSHVSCAAARRAPTATPIRTSPTSTGTRSSPRTTTPCASGATSRSARASKRTRATAPRAPAARASSATCRRP